ncbi:RNA-binding protein 39 [Anopheles marshallii]|uniref:RNA-binding protein 39 n=1 Tax=Anopheles marshallii TaxID=1521116 RepID=UPI00237B6262|nr:RNA-binding protein 39 [Anopheles marshallii]
MKSSTFYDHETRKEHHISDKMAADDELNNEVLNLLEAPYKKEDDASPVANGSTNGEKKLKENGHSKSSRHRSRSRERDRERERDRDREQPREREAEGRTKKHRSGSPGRSRDKERRRSKERSKSRSPARRDRSKDRPKEKERVKTEHHRREVVEKRRSRERDHRRRSRERDFRRRSRSRDGVRGRGGRRSMSPKPYRGRGRGGSSGYYRDRSPLEEMTQEDRDARTVFCMQLSQRIHARDLEEFFSSVGKVRDVRLITCNKTKRFKGIAYIEFKDPESVALALGLSGQKLLGIPISVQHTQAEKNRMASQPPAAPPKNPSGPMRLYVGSLHFNITEDMLNGIFEPFGKIDNIQLIMDADTGRSKGYGFITFHNADDAKKALEQLNGFELAGRPMKVGNVTERLDVTTHASLDTDEMDRSGIELGATGRLQLMFKLAEGAGLAVPRAAADALLATAPQPVPQQPIHQSPPIATQCFLLSNMFDPATETNPSWDLEIQDDVIEECNKHGGVQHVYVDKQSPSGNVYVKCPSIATAVLAVNALHGRWFAGRVIGAAYVPLINYYNLFPDASQAVSLLQPKRSG